MCVNSKKKKKNLSLLEREDADGQVRKATMSPVHSSWSQASIGAHI
jgi:hypothetical protein